MWIILLSVAYVLLYILITYDIITDNLISWGFMIAVIIILIIIDIVIYSNSDKWFKRLESKL
jgi:hypothetical protein